MGLYENLIPSEEENRYELLIPEEYQNEAYKELDEMGYIWNSGLKLFNNDNIMLSRQKYLILNTFTKRITFGFNIQSPHTIYYPGIFTEKTKTYENLLI